MSNEHIKSCYEIRRRNRANCNRVSFKSFRMSEQRKWMKCFWYFIALSLLCRWISCKVLRSVFETTNRMVKTRGSIKNVCIMCHFNGVFWIYQTKTITGGHKNQPKTQFLTISIRDETIADRFNATNHSSAIHEWINQRKLTTRGLKQHDLWAFIRKCEVNK